MLVIHMKERMNLTMNEGVSLDMDSQDCHLVTNGEKESR